MLIKEIAKNSYIDRSFFALGTINYIKVFGYEDKSLIDQAVEKVLEIDDMMSAFKRHSDVSRLSHNAGYRFVKINNETLKLLKHSIKFSKMSCGAFDITIRPLVELWGIGKKQNYIPSESEIENTKGLVNYNDILIDEDSFFASLKNPGQAVDLGSIAKGYAADEVRKILLNNGITNGLINLGGNIITIGNRPDGKPWQIGIQNPLAPTGQYLGILSVTDKTIVTSGSNERFFIKNGIRYHHILDPRTGRPAQSSLLSVTAVCDSSTDADALTTALFVLGLENGMHLLKKLKAQAIFITEDLGIITTDGLNEEFLTIKL